MADTTIAPYRPEWANAFCELNRQWIERFFRLEESDWKVLRDPQHAIVSTGGQIFFAVDAGMPIGTVAVLHTADTTYEMAKMVVAPSHQRRGLGEQLGRAAIEWARSSGGMVLYLETNDSLTSALRLYERLGFKQTTPPSESPYARSNVYMELRLDRPPA